MRIRSYSHCPHSHLFTAYWKREIDEAGGNVRRVWRMVDNLLGKNEVQCYPLLLDRWLSWFHRLKNCGCSNSDCNGISADIYTVYPPPPIWWLLSQSASMTSYVPSGCHLQNSVPLAPSNVAQGMCVHCCSVHHTHTQSVAHWWWLPVALETMPLWLPFSWRLV